MKIWVDDLRPPPKYESETDTYCWCTSVNSAKNAIEYFEEWFKVELIDLDHDAGDYVSDGGDYIKILDWLEETGRNYPIRIHSMNPVGRENMRAIIHKNEWKEVYWNMTLQQMNEEYENLKQTAKALENAMKKFEGTNNIENYLDYDILYKARECVISSMNRFLNRDWK